MWEKASKERKLSAGSTLGFPEHSMCVSCYLLTAAAEKMRCLYSSNDNFSDDSLTSLPRPPFFRFPKSLQAGVSQALGWFGHFYLHPKAPGDPGGGKGTSDHIQTHKEKEMKLLESD